MAQVVRAGARNFREKGQEGPPVSRRIGGRAELLQLLWDQVKHLLPGLCHLDSHWFHLSDGHTQCLKLVDGSGLLVVMAWPHCVPPLRAGHVAGLLRTLGELHIF